MDPSRRRVAIVTTWFLAVAVVLAGTSPVARAQQREPGFGVISVAPHDGWFTEAQAERGAEAYSRHCVRCHGVELQGTIGFAPPLSGPRFLNRWSHNSVNRLFNYVKAMMPLDMPAALEQGTYVDIIAFVFRENRFPAGSDELRADPHQLGQLIIPPLPPSPAAGSEERPEADDPRVRQGLPEEDSGVEPEAQ